MISKAFVITFLSGMSTLMGALLLLVFKENKKILIYSLSFAAGVMLFISILDLIPLSIEYLSSIFNNKLVYLNLILFIFVGIFLSKLIVTSFTLIKLLFSISLSYLLRIIFILEISSLNLNGFII